MSENDHRNSFYDSDSFISDNGEQSSPRKQISSQPVNRIRRDKGTRQIYMGTGKGLKPQNKRLQNRPIAPVNYEATAQRVLSARNHKIIDQSNAIHHLTQQIEELKNENKTLKTQTFRQEKVINKIETKQTDLPRILDQHEAEVINLKELLRRSKENCNIEMKLRKESDIEVAKLRDSLTKANQLINDKNLDERNTLQQRINDLQEKMEAKDKYLETFNKHKENLEKTHKQEIHCLKKQIKKCSLHCQTLENEIESLKLSLKEKEKLLEIQNIYSQRFKGINKVSSNGNDRNIGAVFSSEHDNVELLEKLDFSAVSQGREDKRKEEVHQDSLPVGDSASNFLTPERIKQDIRQIIEEEILSGRIKHFEVRPKPSGDGVETVSSKSVENQSNDGRSTMQDSYNTDRAVESDVFDKEVVTQVQVIPEVVTEVAPAVDLEAAERERAHRQLLLQKLSELDSQNSPEESKDSPSLPYSYPRDDGLLATDDVPGDIETIPSTVVTQPPRTYKFNGTIDNLHNGLPTQQTVTRPGRPVARSTASQKNNSSVPPPSEEVLPPLDSAERKRRESVLLSELFGSDFAAQPVVHGRPYPTGTRRGQAGSLLWQGGNDRAGDVRQSEEIEEIML